MTLEQVIEVTAQLLGGINVPAALTEQIGVPVSQAIGNLNACLEAIREAKKKEDAEDGAEADPE